MDLQGRALAHVIRCQSHSLISMSRIESITVYKFPKDEVLKRKWTEQVKRTRGAQPVNILFYGVTTLLLTVLKTISNSTRCLECLELKG